MVFMSGGRPGSASLGTFLSQQESTPPAVREPLVEFKAARSANNQESTSGAIRLPPIAPYEDLKARSTTRQRKVTRGKRKDMAPHPNPLPEGEGEQHDRVGTNTVPTLRKQTKQDFSLRSK